MVRIDEFQADHMFPRIQSWQDVAPFRGVYSGTSLAIHPHIEVIALRSPPYFIGQGVFFIGTDKSVFDR